MVAAFDYCLHGKGGAAPSIDTAMHGLVDAAHVDHLHPDSGIAIATAADGEELTAKIFGDRVVWVPWRRPGFQLGLDIAAIKEANPQAIGCILGGHGITAWGDTCGEAEANSLWIIDTAASYIDDPRAGPSRSAQRWPGTRALPEDERRAKAAALAPTIRGLASTDKPLVGHFTDVGRGARLPRLRGAPAAGRAGHQLPGPLPAHQGQAAACSTCPPTASVEESIARLHELHEAYRADYQGYYERNAIAGLARRSAAPTRSSCSSPASACSATARTSRPPGSPASSTSTRST